MSNMEAATVAKLLVEQLFSRFGVQDQIHSDQGRQFESNLFAEMCKLFQIDKIQPHHISLNRMAWLKVKGLIKPSAQCNALT